MRATLEIENECRCGRVWDLDFHARFTTRTEGETIEVQSLRTQENAGGASYFR